MAAKKRKSVKKTVKRNASKKSVVQTTGIHQAIKSIPSKIKESSRTILDTIHSKVNLILKNLLLFVVLFIVFFVLYNFSSLPLYENLFLILTMIFGFLSIAFLIALLVFVFMRLLKK